MDLEEKLEWFQTLGNEQAMGYNDSGCFWTFYWGNRGAGQMIDGTYEQFSALDAATLGDALDALRAHIETRKPPDP